jgi:cephalosporin-C deacetylase-like acetyl esterase
MAGLEGLVIATQLDQPGFVRIKILAFEKDGSAIEGFVGGWGVANTGPIFFEGGACVQPELLLQGKEPKDFDAFWEGMKAKLAEVPLEAVRSPLKSPDPKVHLFALRLSCPGARPVTGYLSIPVDAKKRSLSALCQFQGYGVRTPVPPTWVHPSAIVLNINAHGMELGQDKDYYDQLKEELKNYAFDKEENQNPETAYFHDMSLRVLRALEYVKSLPEWNGKDLASNGGSQGGTQGFWGAGVEPDVSSIESWSPWCSDLAGDLAGRMEGWQPEFTEALAYYDPVFHARRIKGKVHLIANYGDYTCPPSGVWIVYNEIPHKNKSMEVRQGCTHSFTMTPHMSYTVTPNGIRDRGMKED